MWRVAGGTIAAVFALGLATSAASVSALTPNTSVFMAGGAAKAETGVLTATSYTRKRTINISGVTAAAATRTSLALYSRASGKLRTGTFRGGIYKAVETITVRSGFTSAVGSCDSLLLYNRLTGRAMSGTLIGGRFRNRTTFFLPIGFTELAASCDTTFFSGPNDLAVAPKGLAGSLSGGDWTKGLFQYTTISTRVGMNSSTFVLSNGTHYQWGAAQGGAVSSVDSTTIATAYAIVAGAGSNFIWYESDGTACLQRVVAGVVGSGCTEHQFPAGRTIIVGGR